MSGLCLRYASIPPRPSAASAMSLMSVSSASPMAIPSRINGWSSITSTRIGVLVFGVFMERSRNQCRRVPATLPHAAVRVRAPAPSDPRGAVAAWPGAHGPAAGLLEAAGQVAMKACAESVDFGRYRSDFTIIGRLPGPPKVSVGRQRPRGSRVLRASPQAGATAGAPRRWRALQRRSCPGRAT